MAVFVDTLLSSNGTDTIQTYPSYLDPLFLVLIFLLTLPGILINPLVLKSRLADLRRSGPSLLFACLCGVFLFFSVFLLTSWSYFILKEAPSGAEERIRDTTTLNEIYTYIYFTTNLYSTIKQLRKEDETPAETREQRRNGVKMIIILVGCQLVQSIYTVIDIIISFIPTSKFAYFVTGPIFTFFKYVLFQCFQTSYTAVVMAICDERARKEVRRVVGWVLRRREEVEEGDVVMTVVCESRN